MTSALPRRLITAVALVATVLAAAYWFLLASDRYVSEAHVIVQRSDIAGGATTDLSSLLSSAGSGRPDQLLLRDYLLSVDMLRKLDAVVGLRAHYSDSAHDLISRMWSTQPSIENFHRHYLTRVSVEIDDYVGVLVIRAQAYDPATAQAITTMLVSEGEKFLNQMAQSLALAQVDFLENQVSQMNRRSLRARSALLQYQNTKGLVSPLASAENIAGIVARLEAQRTELQTQRNALQAYLVPQQSSVVLLDQQLAAIERQIAIEKAKLTSNRGQPLNRTVEEFQRLEMEATFAQDIYKTALVALEKGRFEATRTIKKVSVLQAPTRPEYPLEPRRAYNALVSLLLALLLGGVAHLLLAIVRDHQD
jgi:capsular polysaccharide transport system permease protein